MAQKVTSKEPSGPIAKGQELYYEVDNDQYYLLKNGERIPCDSQGNLQKRFALYGTGHYSFQDRERLAAAKNKLHLLPSRPASLAPVSVKSYYRPPTSKFDGYMQFPRPLSQSIFSEQYFTHHPKSPIASSILDLTTKNKEITKKNTEKNTEKMSPKGGMLTQTCSFFSPMSSYRNLPFSKSTFSNSSQMQLRQMASSAALENVRHSQAFSVKGLPTKQSLFNSTLKHRHIDALRQTFTSFKNLNRISEGTAKLLQGEEIGEKLEWRGIEPQARSYRDIKETLSKEAKEMCGYKPPVEKEVRLAMKGIYNVKAPTEADLYKKGREWRKLANPKAFELEAQREKRDRELLEKRKQQRELKVNAFEAFLKAKDKAFAKQLKEQEIALAKENQVRKEKKASTRSVIPSKHKVVKILRK